MARFSVVVPTGNRAAPAHKTVRSVLDQTYRDLEVVVVGEGLTAEQAESLRSGPDPRCRVVRQAPRGTAAAVNEGVRHASGQHVAFLDNGDVASPRWLETMDGLLERSRAPIARCGALRLGRGEVIRDVILPPRPEESGEWIRSFLPGTFTLPRDVFERVGGFPATGPSVRGEDLARRLWEARPALRLSAATSPSLMVRKHSSGETAGAALDPPAGMSPERGSRPRMVSVVIPAYNAAATLGEQLAALDDQGYEEPWEVIVVDDASTDGTVEVAERWAHRLPLRVLPLPTNRGVSHARTMGAAAADGDFLAYCDADDRVAPGWLNAITEAAETYDVVGGAVDTEVLNPPDVREASGRRPLTEKNLETMGFLPFAIGANFGVWRDVAGHLGGWREEYRTAGEDVEFSWRAQLAGCSLGFAPDGVVHYRLRADLRAYAKQWFRYAASYARLYRDYRRAGIHRRSFGEALRRWGYLAIRVPDVVRGRGPRDRWVRAAATDVGRLWGSATCRVFYP
jgi:glycosyltransferase involved in cell wall biosynthesis